MKKYYLQSFTTFKIENGLTLPIGWRSTGLSTFNLEQYWDILILFESKFYQYKPQDYKLWTAFLIKRVGSTLKQLVHGSSVESKLYDIGSVYFTILDPTFQLFGKILHTSDMGKIASILFHNVSTTAFSQDLRNLMLKIWEFLDQDHFQCDIMIFYIPNKIEDHDFVSSLLRNLSWLNGSLRKPLGTRTPDPSFNSIHWSDDQYVVLEFQV